MTANPSRRRRAAPADAASPPAMAPPQAAPEVTAPEVTAPEITAQPTTRATPRARPARATPTASRHGSAEAPRRARKMSAAQAAAFVRTLAAHNPAPRTELNYTSPYTLLVAVALSAQATDVSVNKATATLFPLADTPQKMVALGEAGLAEHIRRIGLWKAKARNVIALSRLLIERHGGEVPADRAALEALPGVGRKTANVVLNVAFGEEAMAVDTHIFRLGNRTGLAPGRTPRAVEEALMKRVPPELLRDAHHWLILHGRYICKARLPECWHCVVRDLCNYGDKVLWPPPRAA